MSSYKTRSTAQVFLLVFFGILSFIFAILLAKTSTSFAKEEILNLDTNETYSNNEITLGYDTAEANRVVYKGKLHVPRLRQKSMIMYIDDCLESMKLNGEEVNLVDYFRTEQLCYSNENMPVFLTDNLPTGVSNVEFTVKNKQGGVALYLMNSRSDFVYSALFFLLVLSASSFTYLLSLFIFKDRNYGFAVALFIAIGLAYLSITPWHARTHDVHGHLEFIQILERGDFPTPTSCWECHQQPLYYLISAQVNNLSSLLGINGFNEQNLILQLLNLGFFTLFVLYGLATLELAFNKINTSTKHAYILGLLFALWPSGILHSVRIGNDSIVYATIAISTYFLYRWYIEDRSKYLRIAMIASFIAAASKVTGIVMMPTILVVMTIRYNLFTHLHLLKYLDLKTAFKPIFKFLKKTWILILVFIFSTLVITFGPTFLSTNGKEFTHMNEPGNENFKMQKDMKYFVYFDLKEYLTTPTFHTWDDCCGRNNFWVAIPKSSLFGEFGINNEFNKSIMTKVINLLSFGLIVCGLIQFYHLMKQKDLILNLLPILMVSALLFASVIYFRWQYPYYSNQDFRYMYPFLIGSISILGINDHTKLKSIIKKIDLLSILMILSILIFFSNAIMSTKY